MPIFIDESGDTGLVSRGGSSHFRLCAVWIPSDDEATECRRSIQHVRAELGLRNDFEFKFSSTKDNVIRRQAFFRAALKHDFRFCVCSIDKQSDPWKDADRDTLLQAALTSLAATMRPTLLQASQINPPLKARIAIDRNDDETFIQMVKVTFRGIGVGTAVQQPFIHKVTFHDSKVDELIQLADMVCGCAGDYLDGNEMRYAQIQRRVIELFTLP